MRHRQQRTVWSVAAGIAALVAALAPSPAARAEAITTYNPSVSFGYARTGNVTYFGEDRSDDSWNALVSLPWSRVADTSRTSLGLTALYSSYRQFSTLDDLAYFANASHSRELSRRTSLRFSVRASRSQDQGNPFEGYAGNYFLARRTVRHLAGANVSIARTLSRRWNWTLGADAALATFDEIDGFDPGDVAPTVEDSVTYSIVTGISRTISERSSMGASYRFGVIRKDVSPDERGHVATLDYNRKIRERGTLGVSVGGYRRSQVGVTESPGYRGSGVYVSANLGFGDDLEVGPVKLRFQLGGGPSMGDGLSGTSTNYEAGVIATQADFRPTTKWRWSIAARYSYRMPSDRDQPDTASFSTGGSLERPFGQQLSARVQYRWIEQDVREGQAANGSYQVLAAGLVWYPLGGSRAAVGR